MHTKALILFLLACTTLTACGDDEQVPETQCPDAGSCPRCVRPDAGESASAEELSGTWRIVPLEPAGLRAKPRYAESCTAAAGSVFMRWQGEITFSDGSASWTNGVLSMDGDCSVPTDCFPLALQAQPVTDCDAYQQVLDKLWDENKPGNAACAVNGGTCECEYSYSYRYDERKGPYDAAAKTLTVDGVTYDYSFVGDWLVLVSGQEPLLSMFVLARK